MAWTNFNDQQWLKWKATLKHQSDFPDKEARICRQFECNQTLTLEEQLCGEFCQLHSNLPKKSQPMAPMIPSNMSAIEVWWHFFIWVMVSRFSNENN